MPVTKKKGAIFEIYADSPVPDSKRSSTSSSSSNPRSSANSGAGSPSRPRRPALASLPVTRKSPALTTTKAKSSSSKLMIYEDSSEQGKAGKPLPEAGSGVPKPKSSSAASSSGKKLQVYVDVPSTSKSASSSSGRKPLGAVSAPAPAPLRALGSRSTSSSSAPLRTKSSGRAFDIFTDPSPDAPPPPARITTSRKRAASPFDKENAAPSDSPASRTRSKVDMSSSTVSGVLRSSPLKSKSKALSSKPLPLSSKPALGKKPLQSKKPSFAADGPLADVSVAYDATGIEPEGFRTQAQAESGRSRRILSSR